ncbi:transcriptional regulator [Arachidicoccus ginsenosidimutans]|uniref:helix-turn-helix transcriptional regulator n=1 Tax=Arachidicoccus sp. BS20 TaxID=1850526 RepID=UPI0007F06E6B|nr:transcriptional regulator [Arachidicoccus sp. BS20]ANI90107.1 transcriptional regulator [Arachidicoccus sp. BS20]
MAKKEIQAADIWNDKKLNNVKDFILIHSAKQSKERIIQNELLAIKYKIEDYIESDVPKQRMNILDFVEAYLSVLNVTKKSLAALFEMHDSNLYKYLTGERKLNTDFVLKLSAFSHIDPEYWLRIEIKNELFDIKKEEKKSKNYKKYDYKNLLETVE